MKRELYIGFLALSSLLVFSGCSSDEPAMTGTSPESETSGEKVYINVRLATTDDASTRGDDNGFVQADTDILGKAINARFFFFDAAGKYVTEGSVWSSGSASTSSTANVEYASSNVLVLNGVTSRPTYVVAIVNAPSSLTTPSTVYDLENVVISATYDSSGSVLGQSTNMYGTMTQSGTLVYPIMTSSSYNRSDVNIGGKTCPYVTIIKSSDFKESATAASVTDPVTIYVERLCSRITVDLSQFLSKYSGSITKNTSTTTSSSYAGAYVWKTSGISIEGLTGSVYIRLDLWQDNAVNPESYLMKHIDSDWTDTALGFTWNDASNYRCYWGKSTNYGDASATYPKEYKSGMSSQLVYHSYGLSSTYVTAQGRGFAEDWMVSENTNTSDIVSAHSPSALTSVVIKGRFVTSNSFANSAGVTVIKFKDKLYTESAFKKLLLTYLKNKLGAYYIYYSSTFSYRYSSLLSSYYDTVFAVTSDTSRLNGAVKIGISSSYSSYSFFTDSGDLIPAAAIESAISEFQVDDVPNGYKEGCMYWNVPLEHLNNAATVNKVVPEGKYGVVRNHWYKVMITDILKEGKGVWDPTEPIVPSVAETNATSSYLNSEVKVLSWKKIVQGSSM